MADSGVAMKQFGAGRFAVSIAVVIASAIGSASAQPKVYWIDSGVVHRAGLDGRHIENVVEESSITFNGPVSVDPLGGHIYWSFSLPSFGQIRRSNLYGERVEYVLPLGLFVGPGGIAVDSANRLLYITDPSDCVPLCGSVIRTELNSDDLDVVISLDAPYALAVDPMVDRYCWYDEWNAQVVCSKLTGGPEIVIASELYSSGVAIDGIGGQVYWTDATDNRIRRADLDGSHPQDLVIGLVRPHGIAVDPASGKIYWSDKDAGKIQRANLDGSGVEDVLVGLVAPLGIALDLGQGAIDLVVERSELDWSEVEGALLYDVVLGSLPILRDTQGGFGVATLECLANDVAAGGIELVDDPPEGSGIWFLVRAVTSTGNGTWDGAGFPQVASRDAGIAVARTDCD
jgi:hypothetical protein